MADPQESHQLRFLCVDFRHVKTVVIRIDTLNEAELLRGSTFPPRPTVFPACAAVVFSEGVCTLRVVRSHVCTDL